MSNVDGARVDSYGGRVPGAIQSVERAVAVLRLLATGPRPLSLGEVAGSLGLPKATTHGLLATLVAVGFVEHDRTTGHYSLDGGLHRVDSHRTDGNVLRSLSMNWADSLAAHAGEAVHVGMLVGRCVEVVHHVFRPDDTPQRLQTGLRLPVHATALGKVLLAAHPALVGVLGGDAPEAFTTRTLTGPADLVRTVAEVRARGFAVAVGEHEPDRADVAAPVRDAGGLVVGAVGLTGAVDRLCDGRGVVRARYAEQVVECARNVSAELAG
ncbi:IclR family transcriptional regulator [Aquipuribacter nitratireducens]|uniref:IclR family transcriptional regulator n=1 Tax=Aquipuribacter nitratireducens TaxID=650104 RepID=A0ABW0GJU8_9MICO